jgi:hypothetical protein
MEYVNLQIINSETSLQYLHPICYAEDCLLFALWICWTILVCPLSDNIHNCNLEYCWYDLDHLLQVKVVMGQCGKEQSMTRTWQ